MQRKVLCKLFCVVGGGFMSDLRDSEVKVWTHTCTSFLGFSQDAAPVADGYTSAMGFALGEKS